MGISQVTFTSNQVNGDYKTKALLVYGLKDYPIFSVIFSEKIREVCVQK